MTIEAGIENPGVYINSLNDSYPANGDTLTEGDNHIRGLKNVIVNTFAGVTGAVTSTHTELNYVDVTAIGTVEASKAVVVDANKDALGFRKITGSTSTGNAASFTYTGTTNSDAAILADVTGVTGNSYAVAGLNASATGYAILGQATHATGVNYGVYGQSNSSAGYGVYAVASVAGGIPVWAVAHDSESTTATVAAVKGSRSISLNPRVTSGGYNPITQAGDQIVAAIGPTGADSGVLVLAPYATDTLGIRIDSTVDEVQISGTIPAATITAANIATLNVSGNISGYVTSTNGDFALCETMGTYSAVPGTTYVKVIEWLVGQGGTIDGTFTLDGSGGSTWYGRLYINGVAAGTERSLSSASSATEYREVITVARGDLVQLYVKTATAGGAITITDANLYVDSGAFVPAFLSKTLR